MNKMRFRHGRAAGNGNNHALPEYFVVFLAVLGSLSNLTAQVLFFDDFNAGVSPLWSNLRGDWTASGGVYYAQAPTNAPPTITTLPFDLGDFAVDVDVNNLADGGVWMRTDAAGQNAVILVVGGRGYGLPGHGSDPQAGHSIYWHTISGGSISSILNEVQNVFPSPGSLNYHLRVSVTGSVYSAYLNGSNTPITTLTYAGRTDGLTGLYSFWASQSFDNFSLQAAPTLMISDTASGVATLQWRAVSTFSVETRTNLGPGDVWVPYLGTPGSSGGIFSLSVMTTDKARFFRLRYP